jgi:2-polyprenyl-3-methyl-5-hydroxy-6-metoxy-1,4-benzoquinol methylase
MRKFNYQNYYKDYWTQEFEKRRKENYYETLYDPIKKYLISHEKLIVDVGGGNGQLMDYLRIKNPKILDISESGLKFAREHFGFKTIKSDVQKRYPLKENSVDTAYCFEVLEHLENPNKTLCEINNILKSNRTLFLSIPNFKPDGVHHKRKWRFNELKEDVKKCGFEVVWFKNIPRFNLSYRRIINGKASFIQKTVMLAGHTIFFSRLRNFLAKKIPDLFVAMYIVKCKKR